MWFRRDLRLHDQPALMAAAAQGTVLPLVVLDPHLLARAGAPRLAYYLAAVRALQADLARLGATLLVRHGDPRLVVPAVVAAHRARAVHVSADFGPYGRRRDAAVAAALGSVPLAAHGSAYAVRPDRLTSGSGSAYRVFSAFYRAWQGHGWPAPAAGDPAEIAWVRAPGEEIPADPPGAAAVALPPAGERAAWATWEAFRDRHLGDYATGRDRPDLDASSHLSPHLKVGAIHPRTVLAELKDADESFRRELAWREFYAAVLFAWPESARAPLNPAMRRFVAPAAEPGHIEAWRAGRTGYPIVDAGMRQLRAEAWMPNRVRMIVASFLVKDLHLPWQEGARHFMGHLADGDLASNQHGWQWVAGTGTDAAPYFRIFNPTTQAKRVDPAGSYVRRHVPELAELPDALVHEPWRAPGGPPGGYPLPIVDHDEERRRSLDAYAVLRATGAGRHGR